MTFFSFVALSDGEISALFLSIKVAGVAVLWGLPFAYFVALLLARGHFLGRGFLNLLVLMPLVLPPVVTGYILLIAFGGNGFFGKFLSENFGISFAFHWTGAALASGLMAFPLMVRPIRQVLESIDEKLIDAAKSLGAGYFTTFWSVILPLSVPGILVASILGFAKALGEFGATITFVSNIPEETRTIPLAIFSFLQSPNNDLQLWRMTVLSIFLAIIAVFLSELFTYRSKNNQRKYHD